MIYLKIDENKKVMISTKDAKYASFLGLTEKCEEKELEQAYDGSWYLKGYAPAKPEPTLEEQVAKMESETGLTRVMREMVLAEGSGASEYVKAKAQEIEDLAAELRGNELSGATLE